jgi:hypothetical protein
VLDWIRVVLYFAGIITIMMVLVMVKAIFLILKTIRFAEKTFLCVENF